MGTYDLSVIGAGYVGLVTAVGLTTYGHRVHVAEIDEARLSCLKSGGVPFYEPGLRELVARSLADGKLTFHNSNREAVIGTKVAFVAVPTIQTASGDADLSVVEEVVVEIAPVMEPGSVIIIKSTVPPGSARHLQSVVDTVSSRVSVGSNPEFLSQGRALEQFLKSDRIVLGADDDGAQATMMAIYSMVDCPIVLTDPTSAELIKYGSNTFLAMRISFINSLARMADLVGADIDAVSVGMGHDARIGQAFLKPGPGFGGSCLPKDTQALIAAARNAGYDLPLLEAVLAVNREQLDYVIGLVADGLDGIAGRTIAVWGLAFKAGTDDIRESPAFKMAAHLIEAGAEVRVFDPMVLEKPVGATAARDPIDAAAGADAVIVATEWEEFAQVDLGELAAEMRGTLVVDARNLLDSQAVQSHGLSYAGVGRGSTRVPTQS